MPTILYRNALLFINGVELTGALHDLAVDYSAETLDSTVMGADTRTKAGGMFNAKVSGKGFFDSAIGLEALMFPVIAADDAVFTIFPDGLTEGSITTGMGYGLKGVLTTLNFGGHVGILLEITFAAESRGIFAPGVQQTP